MRVLRCLEEVAVRQVRHVAVRACRRGRVRVWDLGFRVIGKACSADCAL